LLRLLRRLLLHARLVVPTRHTLHESVLVIRLAALHSFLVSQRLLDVAERVRPIRASFLGLLRCFDLYVWDHSVAIALIIVTVCGATLHGDAAIHRVATDFAFRGRSLRHCRKRLSLRKLLF